MLIDTVEIEHRYEDTIYGYDFRYGIDALTYFSYHNHLRKKLSNRLARDTNKAIMLDNYHFHRTVQERLKPKQGILCL